MKKILVATGIILILALPILFLFRRSVKEFFTDKSKLQELSLGENGRTLHWNDKTYEPYGNIPDFDMKGAWFGKVRGEKYMRVYLYNGQQPEEWLVVLDSTLMGGYIMFKENAVVEIPEGFAAHMIK